MCLVRYIDIYYVQVNHSRRIGGAVIINMLCCPSMKLSFQVDIFLYSPKWTKLMGVEWGGGVCYVLCAFKLPSTHFEN